MVTRQVNVDWHYRIEGGTYLRQLREQANLLARDVANDLEISRPLLSMIENGRQPLNPAYIPKLAGIYGVPEGELAKQCFRFRDPLLYALIFGDEGDESLKELLKEAREI